MSDVSQDWVLQDAQTQLQADPREASAGSVSDSPSPDAKKRSSQDDALTDAATAAITARPRRSSRREERAEATRIEIISVSRRILADGRELSLRAVAAEMGVSAPALYRYVESVNQLVMLVSAEILKDVTDRVRRDAAPYENDPVAAVAVGAVSFRHWALSNPFEFRIVFTTTRAMDRSVPDDLTTGRQEAGAAFVALFAGIFQNLLERFRIPIPRPEDMDPEILRAVTEHDPWMAGAPASAPPGFLWLFQIAWTKLYGIITLEVFGHVQKPLVQSGALLISSLREIGFSMGLGEQVERVTRISRQLVDKLDQGATHLDATPADLA